MNQNVYLQYKIAKKYNKNLKYATQMKKIPQMKIFLKYLQDKKYCVWEVVLEGGVYR